jgi:putative membrane protein
MKENMNYMFEAGFLGTRAPIFMDVVTLIVALLPLLVYFAILFAKNKYYKTHALLQNFIFLFSVVVIVYFELGVRVGGGFKAFVADSGVSHTYVSIVLGVHIFIAVVTLFLWILLMMRANYEFKKKLIPGVATKSHIKLALKTFVGIALTSLSGIWVYLLLFVY